MKTIVNYYRKGDNWFIKSNNPSVEDIMIDGGWEVVLDWYNNDKFDNISVEFSESYSNDSFHLYCTGNVTEDGCYYVHPATSYLADTWALLLKPYVKINNEYPRVIYFKFI